MDKLKNSAKFESALVREMKSKIDEIADWVNAQNTFGINMADVKEVRTYSNNQEEVNKLLNTGIWKLLLVKTIEWQSLWSSGSGVEKPHIHRESATIYTIVRIKDEKEIKDRKYL